MAFWDNESRLVQHLCHSFVISDDTGYADRIFIDDEDTIEEIDQGYHINQRILTGTGILWMKHAHSITKREMDETIRNFENESKCKPTIQEKIVKLSHERPMVDIPVLFAKKEIFRQNPSPSLLTKQISLQTNDEIPFFQYSKFFAVAKDSRRSLSVTVVFEEFKIFINVTAIISIRIFELVGLSLYLYHKNKLGVPISATIDEFKLYIADENGDVDRDFPALDPSECLKKFRFSHLGLVRSELLNNPVLQYELFQCVVISYKLGDYPVEVKKVTLPRPANDIQMIEVLSLAIRKKGLIPCETYILSELNDDIHPIKHNQMLSEFDHNRFWLLRQERSNEFDLISNNSAQESDFDSIISHGFEHYEATWLNKKGEPLTQILISEVQIAIKPLILDDKYKQKFKFKTHLTLPKTDVINRNSVLRCDVSTRIPSINGRKVFFISAIKGNEKKTYEFEADNSIASKIILSLSN